MTLGVPASKTGKNQQKINYLLIGFLVLLSSCYQNESPLFSEDPEVYEMLKLSEHLGKNSVFLHDSGYSSEQTKEILINDYNLFLKYHNKLEDRYNSLDKRIIYLIKNMNPELLYKKNNVC